MRNFTQLKVAVAGTGYVGLKYSYPVISAPSCNSSRCNPREGGETQQ